MGDLLKFEAAGFEMDSIDFEKSYLALALGTKDYIYPDIDFIYNQNSIEYYELYKGSSLSTLHCFVALSTLHEEYIRKVIGIIEFCYRVDDHKPIINLIKKGYNMVYRYCISTDVISTSELYERFVNKNSGPTMLEVQNLVSIALYLHKHGYGNKWNGNDNINRIMTESYIKFVTLSVRQDIDKYISRVVTKEQVAQIKDRFQLNGKVVKLNKALDTIRRIEADKLGLNESLDISNAEDVHFRRRQLATQGITQYYSAFERFFSANDFHSFFLDVIEFTEDEVNYIVENCLANQRFFKISEDKMDQYIVGSLFMSMLIKEYRTTRDLYLNKSKEDFILSLKQQKETLEKRESFLKQKDTALVEENNRLKLKNEELSNEVKVLQLQVKKLNLTLEKREDNEKELQSLRDLLFKLEFKDEVYDDRIKLEDIIRNLSKAKIAFVSGQLPLLNRLKELLPNIRCLDIDKLGSDLSFIDKYDFLFIDVSHISHAFYYKLISRINHNDTKICYITKRSNIELVINEMHEFLTS